ncbi:inosine/xanthosine triphosphatase [Halobacteria archaeon AArc-curdl1]|uniref:Probable inosine/xanthosine triphosphatase n=1 Tax=Natronosalvus hydrolyticus TaxID=2979988 RepID=A0AAP3E4T7_9EURY|nr:inosine/xanthosine triphosphatase [Halobacteria archaeon AArc-curdl1]
MKFVVGSQNPVKAAAVETALERYQPTVRPVAVDSGVSEQPSDVDETITGAKTRAKRALAAADGEYGVGLEGGVARFNDELYLIMWAAVTDGERICCGSGPSLRLPDVVSAQLEAGRELGPVVDDLLGTDDIARAGGAAGAFTNGLIDREEALAGAVACAFGPFVTSEYER